MNLDMGGVMRDVNKTMNEDAHERKLARKRTLDGEERLAVYLRGKTYGCIPESQIRKYPDPLIKDRYFIGSVGYPKQSIVFHTTNKLALAMEIIRKERMKLMAKEQQLLKKAYKGDVV